MGTPLNHIGEGAVAWFSTIDANWSEIELDYLSRLKSDTSAVTVSNTTTEKVLMANTTIPANAINANVLFPVYAAGSISVAANTTPAMEFRLRYGGITGVVLADITWTMRSSTTAYTTGFVFDFRLTGLSAGSSGSIQADGFQSVDSAFFSVDSVISTINTTQASTLVWTVQPSLVSASATQTLMITNQD